MNYLAHSYLAFTDEQIVGQFLEDFIRNRDRYSFPTAVQQGITLHREIDTFTDSHPEIHQAKKIFQPMVRLYSGAFVDVAFDYFLARSIPKDQLQRHAQKVYRALNSHYEYLPDQLAYMLQHMEKDNWLYNYRTDRGILFSMQNVLRKAKYLDQGIPVYEAFLANKTTLEKHFTAFFPDLQRHIQEITGTF